MPSYPKHVKCQQFSHLGKRKKKSKNNQIYSTVYTISIYQPNSTQAYTKRRKKKILITEMHEKKFYPEKKKEIK